MSRVAAAYESVFCKHPLRCAAAPGVRQYYPYLVVVQGFLALAVTHALMLTSHDLAGRRSVAGHLGRVGGAFPASTGYRALASSPLVWHLQRGFLFWLGWWVVDGAGELDVPAKVLPPKGQHTADDMTPFPRSPRLFAALRAASSAEVPKLRRASCSHVLGTYSFLLIAPALWGRQEGAVPVAAIFRAACSSSRSYLPFLDGIRSLPLPPGESARCLRWRHPTVAHLSILCWYVVSTAKATRQK